MLLSVAGADPGFQVMGWAHLKKLRRAEGGAKVFGVFRVKNHEFTPKNHMFSNFRGGRRVRPPPWIRPWVVESFVYLIVPKSVQGGSERNAVKDVDKNVGK
jgi:hypothetical protein